MWCCHLFFFSRRENGFPLLFHPSKQLFIRAEEAAPPFFPSPTQQNPSSCYTLTEWNRVVAARTLSLVSHLRETQAVFLLLFFLPLLRFDNSQPGTPPPPPPWCLSATADGDCDTNNSIQAGGGSVDVPQPTTTCVLNFAHQSRRRGQRARRSSAFPSEENAARRKHAEALSTPFFSFII